jgi:hypothetical protein
MNLYKKITWYILLYFISSFSFAQVNGYAAIDAYASKGPDDFNDVDKLYTYLIKPAKTDIEKVRSFYVWIATHIKYDMKSYLADTVPSYEVNTVIGSKLGVCMGMANVMHALCKKAKIATYMVDGYSKGLGYIDGQKITNPEHIWNAIKLNNKWYLFDVTWDVTSTNLPEFYPDRKFKGKYFMQSPEEFMSKHIPSDPIWQLTDYLLPLSDFEKAPENIEKLVPKKKTKFSFNDSISVFQKYKFADSLYNYSRRAAEYNPLNTEAKLLLGLSYFGKGDELVNSLKKISVQEYDKNYKLYESKINYNYEKALSILSEVKPGQRFYEEAKEAIKEIGEYKINTDVHNVTTTNTNYKIDKKFVPIILKKEFECDIHKLEIVNSSFRETNLSISPDGTLLLFMSDRGGQDWSVKRDSEFRGKESYDGDLWYSKKEKGYFAKPICFDKTLNTPSGEDEPNISPDGKKNIYQSWKSNWESTGGPYYIADRIDESVKNAKGLGDGISRFFCACI